MIASLPMYDLPELRRATNAWWSGLARHLRRGGVPAAPDVLTRDMDPDVQWRSPDLLFSQCCGYPLMHEYADTLEVVGTPHYDAPGCEGPSYSSIIVVRADSHADELEELRGRVAVYSARSSHSGYNSFRAMVAPLAKGQAFFAGAIESGGHLESLALLEASHAHVATIDCVTYALLQRYRPSFLEGVRPIGTTNAAPGLPYVTSKAAGPEHLSRVRRAVQAAFADPALAEAREALLLRGVSLLSRSDYEPIVAMERAAVDQGYPELG